jgi:hypothetical protein
LPFALELYALYHLVMGVFFHKASSPVQIDPTSHLQEAKQ